VHGLPNRSMYTAAESLDAVGGGGRSQHINLSSKKLDDEHSSRHARFPTSEWAEPINTSMER
jgi:hypothetical protein